MNNYSVTMNYAYLTHSRMTVSDHQSEDNRHCETHNRLVVLEEGSREWPSEMLQ